MKCVSYVRKVFYSGEVIPVSEQVSQISAYAKHMGWNISRSFADRKNALEASTGFIKMKDAGVLKTYDVVIFYTLQACGCHPTAIWNVLYRILYPANVKFAVAEDDFFSGEHSEKEITEYIKKKQADIYKIYTQKLLKEKAASGILKSSDEKFGFLFDSQKRTLVIDDDTAPIVRHIYQSVLEGMSFQEISNRLNATHIPSPAAFREKSGTRRLHSVNDRWTADPVSRISKNAAYCGRLQKRIGGEVIEISVPAIISEETYQLAQAKISGKRQLASNAKKIDNIFLNRVVDAKTGEKMACEKWKGDYYFRIRKDVNGSTEQRTVLFDDVYDQVMLTIGMEQKLAEDVKHDILLGTYLAEKDCRKRILIFEIQELFSSESAAAQEKNKAYQQFASGCMPEDEYVVFKMAVEEKIRLTEVEAQSKLQCLSETDKIFSVDNPWVKGFTSARITNLTGMQARTLVKQILIMPDGEIQVELHWQDWKQSLLNGKEICHES
ncbi:MAG: recombinase family protein [Eubacteriales bacterium]|nr:recombinase family protein [Eubacteriales bacterium]